MSKVPQELVSGASILYPDAISVKLPLGACLNTRPLTGPAQSPIQGKKLVPKVIISPASTIYCA